MYNLSYVTDQCLVNSVDRMLMDLTGKWPESMTIYLSVVEDNPSIMVEWMYSGTLIIESQLSNLTMVQRSYTASLPKRHQLRLPGLQYVGKWAEVDGGVASMSSSMVIRSTA